MKYEIHVKRSARKTISLEITRDETVLVRAPHRIPENEIKKFVQKHTDWIATHMEKQRSKIASRQEPTEEEIAELKLRAKDYLPQCVEYYSQIMGFSPSGVKITSAKTRFGSCSSKNSICFSWRLMMYPEPAIDYVVVHELAHIPHKNHSKSFYDLIFAVLPDYKNRRKLLKG